MTAADLRADFTAALANALAPCDATVLHELLNALDAVIREVQAECFANSPISVWLVQSTTDRFAFAEYDENAKRIRVDLHDVGADDEHEDDPVARGFGESVEEAIAAALNGLEGARQ